MKVLIACERSQIVTSAFRALGHEAYSCDIQDQYGGNPEWHLQQDVIPLLSAKWDLVIAHPPCTYLAVSGNAWFNEAKYGDKARERKVLRSEALSFFLKFTELDCPFCIENPVGVVSTAYRKPDQIINPWWFGDKFEKKTCLWLNKLPLLKPTNIVACPPRMKLKSGKTYPSWMNKSFYNNPEGRRTFRSQTFRGIAAAMAEQWG